MFFFISEDHKERAILKMIIDIIAIAILLISAALSFLRGLVREVLTIAGVVGGLAAAYILGPFAMPFFAGILGIDQAADATEKFLGVVPYPLLSDFLAYASIFLIVVILLSVLSHFLSSVIHKTGLGLIDRTLGILFGLVRGLLLLALFYLPVHLYLGEKDKEEWFTGSRTIFFVEMTSSWIAEFLPESFTDGDVKEQVQDTREKLESLELLPKQDEAEDEEADDAGAGAAYEVQQRQLLEELIQRQLNPDGTQPRDGSPKVPEVNE